MWRITSAGVARIIYLGGLGDDSTDLSEHLRSRQHTGVALRAGGVPVTEFRAAVIVGSGSLSFEMIRYLTERLPVMICPSWVYTRIQPIAIRDVIQYLVEALATPASVGAIVEIGGSDVLTYGEMMTRYAALRGLTRWLVPVPVLTPRLSSYWVHLVTPIPSAIAEPLIAGLRNEVVVREGREVTSAGGARAQPVVVVVNETLAQTPGDVFFWISRELQLAVRTRGSAQALAPDIRRVVAAADPAIPLGRARTCRTGHSGPRSALSPVARSASAPADCWRRCSTA